MGLIREEQAQAILFEDAIHELNALVGRIGLSRRQLSNYLERGDIEEARGASERLGEAVTELGDRLVAYRGLTQERRVVETFRIGDLVSDIIRLLRGQAEQVGVAIEVRIHDTNQWERPLTVRGDAFQFRLALRNLVLNGIEALGESDVPIGERLIRIEGLYSPPNGTETDAPDGWVNLYVRNNGPPIPDAVRNQIFDRGFSTKHGRGLGLGLGLVQSVAEAHRGRVMLNDVGRGVEFWLRVPAAHPSS